MSYLDLSKFHVVTVISNPYLYKSRYNLYDIFSEDITRKGATLWTVELATGARRHGVTQANNPNHIQVWTTALPGDVWHKENLLNIAIQQLTIRNPDWRYVMCVDADVKFEAGAIDKIAESLQTWDIVQPWSHAIDLGPNGETINLHESFMYCYRMGREPKSKNGYTQGGHPGFAIAMRRDAANKLGTALGGGPLIDWAILGSADRHMLCSLVGRAMDSCHGQMHPNYKKWLLEWQRVAELNIAQNVWFCNNTIRHMWHGRKADRGYSSRWKILVDHQFNPETDIRRDVSGIWNMVSDDKRQQALRDSCRKYYIARKEDATTT